MPGWHTVRAEPRIRDLPLEAVALLGEGEVEEAIRSLRQAEKLSRREARRRIDAHLDRDPMLRVQLETRRHAQLRKILFWVVLIGFAIGAGVLYGLFYRGSA